MWDSEVQHRKSDSGEAADLNDVDLCPICSAGIAGCDHEIVRWSLYASEFEPSALLMDVLTLNEALIRLLRHGRPGPIVESTEIAQLYKLGMAECWLDPDDEAEHRSLPETGVYAVLDAIGRLPGVHSQTIGLPPRQQTLVLWATVPQTVRARLRGWIRELELEVDGRKE
jgi:hypothetical protein